ncbi:PTS system mannose/fructose/sorbose family transporter subunit IID [Desulfuromusa kysingii]|nr:PTS system mannose/fructose/sorbose family transporter subunit IID [Desulfuromusa kysingii]
MAIPRKTRIYIWFRLLLLQASWNFERLQGIGFFYCLLPGLKKLYSGEKLLTVSRKYAGYFNTHVYLAPMVAGAVLKLEEDRAQGIVDPALEADDFKEMVAAPYAAIGDALFWGGVRPLAAGVALFFAIKGILWAPLIFLLVYNILPMWFRTVFFARGYRQGMRSVEFIQQHRLPDWAIHTKEAAVVVLGGLSAFMVYSHLNQVGLPSWLGMLTLIPMVILVLVARQGLSPLLLILITGGSIFLIGLFGADMICLLESWGLK